MGNEESVGYLPPIESRRMQINRLPIEGFDSVSEQKRMLVEVAAIGLPVANITSLHRRKNEIGSETTLGSWGIGAKNCGEYSIYQHLEKKIPEKRLGTEAHELAHANTPSNPNNNEAFGSQENREAALEFATRLADQTDKTKVFMTGYHKHLYQRLQDGDISQDLFVEETWAIASELALSNRNKLKQVQQAQRMKLKKQGREEDFDALVTMGESSNAQGVDVHMINLIQEVDGVSALEEHVEGLKRTFYNTEAKQKAIDRKRHNDLAAQFFLSTREPASVRL